MNFPPRKPVRMNMDVYPNMSVNREDPITRENFYALQLAIAGIQAKSGEAQPNGAWMHSIGETGEHTISVTRYERGDIYALCVAFSGRAGVSMMMDARNDAGTVRAPMQPAASLYTLEQGTTQPILEPALSNSAFEKTLELVLSEAKQGSFVPDGPAITIPPASN